MEKYEEETTTKVVHVDKGGEDLATPMKNTIIS
jgi:hypothetical protein